MRASESRSPAPLLLAFVCLSACPGSAPERELEAAIATDRHGNPHPAAPPQILNDHANALDDAGKHEEALRFYDAALERYAPEQTGLRATCLFNKGLALRRLARWDESIAAYEAAAALDPERDIALNIATPLIETRRFDEALVWLDRELERRPDDIKLIEVKAMVLIAANRHREARVMARRALALRVASGGREDRRYIEHWRRYLDAHPG